jgi:hypothetical protein
VKIGKGAKAADLIEGFVRVERRLRDGDVDFADVLAAPTLLVEDG